MDLQNLNPNIIHLSNNYGPFRISRDCGYDRQTGHRKVEIEFINTGYKYTTDVNNARNGNVKDPTIKPLNDISAFDNERREEFIRYKLWHNWKDMIRRCTNTSHKEYYAYGNAGITICNEWLNSFDTYFEDCHNLFQFDLFYNFPYQYQLDKDYLQISLPKDQRIYSKETCIFLSNRDNKNLATIDNHKNNPNLTSNYYGVCKINKWWLFKMVINRTKVHEIKFSNEIAAANAFNYFFELHHNYDLVKLHNDVPFMPPEEWSKYIVFKKLVCKIVN